MTASADPLAPLAELPGVAAAGEEAREALGRAHRHRTNLRGWPTTAAEASLRAARASSVLDGGSLQLSGGRSIAGAAGGGDLASPQSPVPSPQLARGPMRGGPDPVLAGALRVSEALEGGATSLVGVWQRAPLQAIARLHALAAADLADDDRLGRPRGDADVGRRMALLADIVTGGTQVPAPVLAAVRLVTIATGLDPHGLGVPEVYWMRHSGDYRAAARGFSSGTPDGLAAWLVLSARALHAGAREALAIAQAVSS